MMRRFFIVAIALALGLLLIFNAANQQVSAQTQPKAWIIEGPGPYDGSNDCEDYVDSSGLRSGVTALAELTGYGSYQVDVSSYGDLMRVYLCTSQDVTVWTHISELHMEWTWADGYQLYGWYGEKPVNNATVWENTERSLMNPANNSYGIITATRQTVEYNDESDVGYYGIEYLIDRPSLQGNGTYDAYIDITWAAGETIPTPPSYCDDGTEILDGPVDIPTGSDWTDTYTTTYDALAVRYTISRTDEVAPSYLHGTASVNRASEDFNEYTSILSVTVPTSATYTGPITSTPGVYGPVAEMSVENTGGSGDDDFTLLSACILEADPPDHPPFCPDGYEVLDQPVTVERGWGGSWTDIAYPPWEQSAATIWLQQDGCCPSMWAYLNDRQWTTNFETIDSGYYSVTLPTDPENGGLSRPLDMEIVNMGGFDFTLASVCLTGTETISVPVNCNLRNHDFLTSTEHWDGIDTNLAWIDVENGAADSDPASTTGTVEQTDIPNVRGTYEISARIRATSVSSANVTLRTRYAGYPLWPDGSVERSVGQEWTSISGNFYLRSPWKFRIESSEDIEIDWACIAESSTSGDDGWRPEIPNCVFPVFDDHPSFSITSLLTSSEDDNWFFWLSNKIADLQVWLLCEIERIILQAISMIIDVLDDMDLPALPSDLSLGSLILWLRRTFEAFGTWLLESWQEMLFSGRTISQWLGDQAIAIAEWFWNDILEELLLWAMRQLEEAGIIGSETTQRVMFLFRNVDIWLEAAADEIEYEFDSSIQLFTAVVDIFEVLIAGIQTGLTGEEELDMGEDLGGFAVYLWRGVEFINDVVDGTPLSGLNVVAMGVIAWGLSQWSIKRFGKMLEFIASSL